MTLEQPKNVILCKDVTSIANHTFKGRDSWKITYKVDGGTNYWLLDWDEAEPRAIKDMWIRKLRRCCPAIPDPVLSSLGIEKKVGVNDTEDPAIESIPSPTPKKPFAKRMSVF